MYDYIKGLLVNKSENSKGFTITLENNGIGYLIEVNSRTFQELKVNNEEIKIYLSLTHKEDTMSLSGFLQKEDRDIFNILQSVSGVGIKSALILLDEFSGYELISAVIKEDDKSLSRAKGIGPKLAKKIILELKDKLINWQKTTPVEISDINLKDISSETVAEVQAVLVSLGYSMEEIKTSIKTAIKISDNSTNSEIILKEALSYLAKN